MPVGRGGRNTEHGSRLFARQSGIITQLDEAGLGGVLKSQFVERFIERQQLSISLWRGNGLKWLTLESATVFAGLFPSSDVDDDPPHRGSGRGKEVASIVILRQLGIL